MTNVSSPTPVPILLRTFRHSHNVSDSSASARQFKTRLAIYATNLIIFLDILAVSIFIPRLVFRLKDLDLSSTYVSLILPAYGLVQIFSCPLIGWGGDSYGRKWILMSCTGVVAVSYFMLGFSTHWILIFAARASAGFFKHTQLLGKAILSDLASASPRHDLCTVLGNSEAFGLMGFIFGPAIGSYLTTTYYPEYNGDSFSFLCCVASAILVLNMCVIAILIPNDENKSSGDYTRRQDTQTMNNNNEEKAAADDDPQSIQTNNSTPSSSSTALTVPVFVTITFLFCTAIHTVRESMSIYVLEKFNVTVNDYGYLVSVQTTLSASATFLSGPIMSNIYSGEYKSVVIHSGILQMISVGALYLNSTSYSIAWISLLCLAIANQYLGVGIKALALHNSTKNSGSVLGFAQTATAVGRTFASILVGLYINNCEQVILCGCFAACLAVVVTSNFVQVQEKGVPSRGEGDAGDGRRNVNELAKTTGALLKFNQFLRFSQEFFSKPKTS